MESSKPTYQELEKEIEFLRKKKVIENEFIQSEILNSFTDFAIRSESNFPAAQAVRTLIPSESVTISHAGIPELSTSFATLK